MELSEMQDKKPNPQGKGQNPGISLLVERSASIGLPDVNKDSEEKIVRDYLSSLFVISCDFKFNPVRGREYYIYSHNSRMLLSLVSPNEGGEKIYHKYLGRCFMRDDFTWALLLVEKNLFNMSSEYKDQAGVNSGDKREELISRSGNGGYNTSLGYYQNVLNFILGKSVKLRGDRLAALSSDRARPAAQLR